ncbi:MAG: hypothetical protein AAF288_12045 [Planctomycetota bacterium]
MTAMEAVAADLRGVRRLSRALLAGCRLAQLAVFAVIAGAALVAIDYLLRLPGPIRLVLGPAAVLLGLAWLGARLLRIHRFWPSLDDLAHRAERMYPQLHGWLASAVEFHLHPERFDTPDQTRSLAEHALSQHPQKLQGVRLKRLIDPTRSVRWIGAALLALGLSAAAVAVAPEPARIAAARWLNPLGDAAWPQRQRLVDTTAERVWPADGRVRIAAALQKGAAPGLQLQVRYRFETQALAPYSGEDQPFETLLITPASAAALGGAPLDASSNTAAEAPSNESARYEALLEPPADLRNALQRGQVARAELVYTLSAGDHTLESARAPIAARPSVASITVDFTPPAYAAGLVETRTAELDPTPGARAAASALAGSQALVTVTWNKPLPAGDTAPWLGESVLPDAAIVEHALHTRASPPAASTSDNTPQATGLTIRFPLQEAALIDLLPADAYGLRPVEPTTFQLRPLPDQPPRVSLQQPAGDESVLATARIDLRAAASDDVAVEALTLDLRRGDTAAAASPDAIEQAQPLDAASFDRPGPARSLPLQAPLELADLGIQPGQTLYLTAVAADVYRDARGDPRAPVRSDTRRLTVVEPQTLVDELLLGLGGVRRDAQRLEADQRAAEQLEPEPSQREQARIGRGVESIQSALRAVDQRIDRNRLQDPDLQDLLKEASTSAQQASDAGDRAEQALARAQQAAQQAAEQERDADQALQDAQQTAQQASEQSQNEAVAPGSVSAQDRAQADARVEAAAERLLEAREQAALAQAEVQPALDQARQAQAEAAAALRKLAATLDAGGEIRAVRREAQELKRQQDALAEQARALLPRTAGRSPESLAPEDRQALQDLQDQQQALADDAGELLDRMRTAAEVAARQGDSPDDQALAQTLAEAADTGQRQGLEPTMRDAAEAAQRNALSQAAAQQARAGQTLDDMLEQLDLLEERKRQALQRRLAELAQRVDGLIAAQRQQLEATRAAAPDVAPQQAVDQSALRRRTIVVQTQAQSEPDTADAAQWLGQAVLAQGQAVTTLRAADATAAASAQAAALQALEIAKANLDDQSDQADEQQTQQERAQLRQAYLELADTQAGLIAQTAPLAEAGRLTRPQAAEAVKLSAEQSKLQQAAAELGQQVQDTLVFKESHARIDRLARAAADRLGQRAADAAVLRDQARVETLLRAMAEALGPPRNNDPWERPPGEGGGGGGGPPPLVPSAAEVKLLQSMQSDLLERTRDAHQQPEPELQRRQDRLRTLGADQRRLHELGQQMIDQLQQSLQPGGAPDEPDPRENR